MTKTIEDVAPAMLYRLGGPEGAPDILLVHGFGSDRYSWSATAPAFLNTHSVWAVELPGHGNTAIGNASDPLAMARAVLAAVSGKLQKPFPLLAHSLGGAVALELARLEPGTVSSMVLLAPAGLGQHLDDAFLTQFPELQSPEEAETLLHKLVSRPRLISPQMVSHVLAFLEKPGSREGLREIASRLLKLEPLAIPEGLATTVIWGENDLVNPVDTARLQTTAAKIHLLPDTGHMPHVEAARKTNTLIAEAISVQ